MTFIQNVFLGFGGFGLLVGWMKGDTNGIIFHGVILICLFLSYILNELKLKSDLTLCLWYYYFVAHHQAIIGGKPCNRLELHILEN